jgi:hypothetical protein
MRQLCALQWRDVDIERSELTIPATITLGGDGYVRKPPKNNRTRRIARGLSVATNGAMCKRDLLGIPHHLPANVRTPTSSPAASAAVRTLNEEGARGWEAVGLTAMLDGGVVVLLKRPRND